VLENFFHTGQNMGDTHGRTINMKVSCFSSLPSCPPTADDPHGYKRGYGNGMAGFCPGDWGSYCRKGLGAVFLPGEVLLDGSDGFVWE